MNTSTITITVDMELSPEETRLLLDYANSNRQSIPDAVRDLLLDALTTMPTPFDGANGRLTIDPPPAMPDVLPDSHDPT